MKKTHILLLLILLVVIVNSCVEETQTYVSGGVQDLTEVPEDVEGADELPEYFMEPEDCLEDEKYDAVEKVCYIECKTEEECAELEEKISKEAEEIGDDFFEGEEDFAEAVPEQMIILAKYKIVNENIKLIEKPEVEANLRQLQDDSEKHKIIWTRFKTLIPIDYTHFLVEFHIGTDGKEETFAAVEQNNNNLSNWNIIVDIQDAFAQGNQLEKEELTYTFIHEFGHLLTLNSNQIDTLITSPERISESMYLELANRCKPKYFADEGCAKKGSYLNLFVETFWKDMYEEWKAVQETQSQEELERFYQKYKDRFITDYAATNPEEDIAESWTAFVLKEKPTGNAVIDKKILFFYEFPELVKIRNVIRARI